MADVLIRGMEMPTRCGLCPMFCDDFNDYCSAAQRSIPFDAEKPEWCPLLPIQEGHGRLIDAERFRVILCRLKERQNDDVAIHALNWAIECLDKLDTIVPAEGGTDECSEN